MAQADRAQVGQTDIGLMGRAQRGDTEAFGVLYDRHAGPAYRTALAVCGDVGRAEDVVQEAFLYLWRSRAAFRPSGSVQGWILLTVRNRAIDSLRREGDRADALRVTVASLPKAQAEVIALAFFGDMTHSEIAEALSLPAGTVKGRMRLGLEKLASRLKAAQGERDPSRAVGSP